MLIPESSSVMALCRLWSGAGKDEERGREWWAKGVTHSIWLRADIMGRLGRDLGLTALTG